MENDLISEITLTLGELPDSRVLPGEDAEMLVRGISGRYKWDLTVLFPWEATEGIAYPYNDPSEWGLLLSSMLSVYTGNVYLVVTNETHFPWPVIELPAEDVSSLLLELPHFEFFVFDGKGERVVVDSQQSELIVLEK